MQAIWGSLTISCLESITRMTKTLAERALDYIARSTNPDELQQIASNARHRGETAVAHAADLRRYALLPSQQPGTFEYDVWHSIHALEGTLSIERRRTTRLGRTRQKIARVGERDTVEALILSKTASDGFTMLIQRGMADLTFEWLALIHPDRFDASTVEAAAARLADAGIQRPPTPPTVAQN